MSGTTPIIVPAGPIQALSVIATAHAAVALTTYPGGTPNFVMLQNSGTIPAMVRLTPAGVAPPAFPVDGTPADGGNGGHMAVLLGGQTLFLPIPKAPTTATTNTAGSITAIGSAAGPAIIYATPVQYQA